ncbi:hypothetical protein GOV13_00315 [Candidatus Pacearchaeota archaeon]|nr:hypothetical protein [Candidatus Pacearchaeota archaeon]
MESLILDSTKKHFPRFIKKMKWWLIFGVIFFGLTSLSGSEGDWVIFLYTFLPYVLGFTIALIIVYYFKYGDEK